MCVKGILSFSETRKKMCFLKKVGEQILLFCEDRTCVGELCVPRILSACGSPEVLSAGGDRCIVGNAMRINPHYSAAHHNETTTVEVVYKQLLILVVGQWF